ncbi:MAG: histidine--tRNA ligase [Pseudomonadales bacterium]|nr:histidine--tRNA ligase [Pseudomonadales bacterium]
MRDILPGDARRWRIVEDTLRRILESAAYEELQLPLLESTELFTRGVGEGTDIVEKEMYSLTDRDGDGITLRPEGTAGCVRALVQHGLLFNQTQRVYYTGPMFRYERPQKGRYRQFYQVGAEAFGLAGPDVDVELMLLGRRFWQALGVEHLVRLELNTLGTPATRAAFRAALVAYLEPLRERLDEDSRRRLDRNPLRILDSKDPGTRAVLARAPQLPDFLDADSRRHFANLTGMLDELGIAYTVNPALVRGLDYYTQTVFEWVTDALGAQGAVCAGGRYDGLVERLGGKPTPAAGFAVGLDRLVLLHEAVHGALDGAAADVYVCVLEPGHQGYALRLAEKLRAGLPGFRIRVHAGGGKLKNQLKRADQCGARHALLVGDAEVADDAPVLKDLRADLPQRALAVDGIIAALRAGVPD